ncbi:MAG: 4Fe-4S ferredoxin iron-sulfur binding domain protein, partial [Deltaproteobacteria bacterium]|nr:4Fe-4S ferredoxin iron-sulfur binding domain protein [Deltaproteobacteria bacterium]
KRGDDGVFEIKTTVATYRARAVVLATGLRGKPRLLAVPGANLEKVQSLLDDPAEFAGAHVLVIGGGDSAVEGAMSLAELGATTTLSYRGDGFKRCKQGNQKRLAEMIAAGKLSVLLSSNVQEFTADAATIKLEDGTVKTIPNQHAFVLIGADTPVVWLEANNVRFVEREHLYALGSTEDVVRRAAEHATECPKSPDEALAILLGKPRQHHRLRSVVENVVEHIHDEFRDVVTSVTGVFKMPTLDDPTAHRVPPRKAKTASHPALRRPQLPPQKPKLVPATNLKRPPSLPPKRVPPPAPKLFPSVRPMASNPFAPEQTVQVAALGRQAKSAVPTQSAPASIQRKRPPPRAGEFEERPTTEGPAFTDKTAVVAGRRGVDPFAAAGASDTGEHATIRVAASDHLFLDTVVTSSSPELNDTVVTPLGTRATQGPGAAPVRAALPGLPPSATGNQRKAGG